MVMRYVMLRRGDITKDVEVTKNELSGVKLLMVRVCLPNCLRKVAVLLAVDLVRPHRD